MRWTKHGLLYSLAGSDDWRRSHTQLPVVDTSSADYWRIYHSSRNADGRSLPVFIDVEPGRPGNIIAEHATPLLELGEPGCFDEHGVMPTAVLDIDGRKHLYYIGWSCRQDVPYENAIGLAVSDDDGLSWRRHSTRALISKDSIDPVFVGTFNVFHHGDGLLGVYMSCTGWRDCDGRLEPRYHLRLARSDDGVHWGRDGHVCIDYADDSEGGIVAASVLAHGDRFHMWYCHRNDRDYRDNSHGNSYRIGYASSADAIDWQRRDDEAGIGLSADGWDSEMICYPCVVHHADELYMFYNGNGFGQSGIGVATRNIGTLT